MTNRNSLLGRFRPAERLTREEKAALDQARRPATTQSATSTTTTRLRWWLHPAFTAGGAASLVGAARPLVA